ncbi:MAG: hypothetical protein N3A54_01930 [Patescibacteria group bacterium]|nr:hypothetical protein [Patescibacteria group bacterium]
MILLVIYHLVVFMFGLWIYRRFFRIFPDMFSYYISGAILGILISIPFTYFLAVLFRSLSSGVYSFIVFVGGFLLFSSGFKKDVRKIKQLSFFEVCIVLFCILISSYIMHKTLQTANDGTILVARNTVFDFGHAISITRSISWGNNIPYSSPFIAGAMHLYHFMFYFWSAIYESFNIPLSFTINIPSVIGFSLFLLMIYVLGKHIFSSRSVGVMGIIFVIFHGGLMFIEFFKNHGVSFSNLWRHQNYLFAGPFDGSVYSLFLTLNVFVNQRHLGFGLAVFFLLYILFQNELRDSKERIILFSFLCSVFAFWHLILFFGIFFCIVMSLILKKKLRKTFFFVALSFGFLSLFFFDWIPYIKRGLMGTVDAMIEQQSGSHQNQVFRWSFVEFVIFNFGISIVFFLIGIWKKKTEFFYFLPALILIGIFTVISIPFGIIDQKYLNVFQVIFCLFAAAGVWIIYQNKFMRIFVMILFPFLLLSGIIDFMVIKIDLLFPIKVTKDGNLVSQIKALTERDAIILGYEEIFDPITLSGRKNYYGFYRQPLIIFSESDQYRKDKIENVFSSQDQETLRYAVEDTGVDYILVPKSSKRDVLYDVNLDLFQKTFKIVIDDHDHLLFKV